MSHEQINQHLSNWTERESTAEAMIPLIGRLYRKNNVVTSVYGRSIINQSVIDIIRAHRFVRQVEDSELSVHNTLPILQAMDKMELGRGHV
ncbi:MAG: glyceraldehyde-3-phosphate dehydrogenase, partial [Nisaea sp.]